MKNTRNFIQLLIIILLLAIGSSFAYFTAVITGSETNTTITLSGGVMNIAYSSGPNINISDIFPREEAWATKTFTLTVNNTTTLEVDYHLLLIVTTNSFTTGALKFTLTGVNTSSNGNVANQSTPKNINTGSGETFLGDANFTGNAIDKVHTYTLKIYFPDTGVLQNENFDKELGAHVEVRSGVMPSFANILLSGYDNIIVPPNSVFYDSYDMNQNEMYKGEDDYGMSYYFKGAKNLVANNLIFANHQWKILRINGNGTIRLLYNGTCPMNSCSINSTGSETGIGSYVFNSLEDDNKYLGYMYGGSPGTPSTSRVQATTNETDSTIKSALDAWYYNNLFSTPFESYIEDTIFCADRQLRSEAGGPESGTGFETSETEYASEHRIWYLNSPTLKCTNKNDRFTVSDVINGNGALTYPIGLIGADEAVMNGGRDYYGFMNANIGYWTITARAFIDSNMGVNWFVKNPGVASNNLNYNSLVRPVINISPYLSVTGTGTLLDPYIVE